MLIVGAEDAHTGTTPFESRADALLLASRLIIHSHRLATEHNALASTGIITAKPGSVNTVPGEVILSLDIRAPSDATLDALEASMRQTFAALAAGRDVDDRAPPGGLLPGLPLTVTWKTDSISPATSFHPECIATVRKSAASVLGTPDLARDMTSGAGHDSVYTSRHCPTSMIFVPSRNGISHNPEEYTSPEDCALGAEVLCQAVVRYDQLRAQKSSA